MCSCWLAFARVHAYVPVHVTALPRAQSHLKIQFASSGGCDGTICGDLACRGSAWAHVVMYAYMHALILPFGAFTAGNMFYVTGFVHFVVQIAVHP